MKKILTLLLSAGLFSCTSNSSQTSTVNKQRDSTAEEINLAEKKAKEESHWIYDKKKDEMTSEVNNSAVLISDVVLPTDSTEEGGNGVIMLMQDGKKTNVVLKALAKDFISNSDGITVKVKFDNEKPTDYICLESQSPDYIFIEKASIFLNKLKTAKKVLIKAEGLNLMKFNATGLKWTH